MNLYHSLSAEYGQFFDVASAVLAVVSAALWFASSRVSYSTGFDTGVLLKRELQLAGKLNAWAAAIAAVVAVSVAAKTFLVGDVQTSPPGGSKNSIALTCLEFASQDDLSVFNSTGLIRAGATISTKSEKECKGMALARPYVVANHFALR